MRIPKRFVGLHAHTGASTYDGLGPPSDHFNFCVENGLDAHAITEHGHMNSFANAFLFIQKWKKAGTKFKYIPGVEAYYHPDLELWKRDKALDEANKANAKIAKTLKKKEQLDQTDFGDEIEMTNALTIENEDESKSGKITNPVNRRHHLVVLPKTPGALLKLFKLVSKSYLEGFYRYPRIDLKMIREIASGDILLSTACLAGVASYATLSNLREFNFDELNATILDDRNLMKRVLESLGTMLDPLFDAVGRENLLLELQFNRLSAQDVVNRALIEFAIQEGLTNQLVVTPDAHYPCPEMWLHREMYKKLGYLNYTEFSPDTLPKCRNDIKAELYPKNAQQVWDEYVLSKQRSASAYQHKNIDDIVADAIERTHDIAHSVINDITFDTSYRYPTSLIPVDTTAFKLLVKMATDGLKKRGLADKPEYVDRLKHELSVIKKLGNASYFITLAKALELAREVCLIGVARGSSGGSLIVYCLGITDLDPIKYECRFDRFLTIHRCLDPNTLVKTSSGVTQISNIAVGDRIAAARGTLRKVLKKFTTIVQKIVVIESKNGTFKCSQNHRWLVSRDGVCMEIAAGDITESDYLLDENLKNVPITKTSIVDVNDVELIDITVDDDKTFLVSESNSGWVNTHNSEAPDIDCDVADRDLVLDVLRNQFGYNNVVPISNMNLFKVKSLLKDISKFYGIPFEEVNVATKTVEQDTRKATLKRGDDKNLFVLKFEDAVQHSKPFRDFIEKYPQVVEPMKVLFREQRSLGRHAGGVVILDNAPEMMPLITNGGEPQAPWSEGTVGHTLEPLGYIKYDLLGLETMRLIGRTINLIIKNRYGQLIELDFGDDGTLRAYEKQLIKLIDGSWINVSNLSSDVDVAVPFEIKDPEGIV